MSRLRVASLSATLVALAAAALAAGGCGYKPVYGEQTAATTGTADRASLASVKVLGIADRRGQILRNYLLDRMTPKGEPAAPRYILSVTTSEVTRITDSRADGTATRADLIVNVRYSLRDSTTDLVVFNEIGQALSTYNLLTARFASVVSEDEARRRAVEQLADQITVQVAMFLNRRHVPARADKAQ